MHIVTASTYMQHNVLALCELITASLKEPVHENYNCTFFKIMFNSNYASNSFKNSLEQLKRK